MRRTSVWPPGPTWILALLALWLAACSGQQQQDEQLEVQDEEYAENGQYEDQQSENGQYDQYANDQGYENQDGYQGSEYGYQNQGSGSNYGYSSDSGYQYADGTESDLQEIIAEMNEEAGYGTNSSLLSQNVIEPLNQSTMASDASSLGAMAANPSAMSSDPATSAPLAPMDGMSSAPIPFQPGGSPAGTGLPELGSKMPYIVQAGDTLARIATKIYGDPSRWPEMASLSGLEDPSRIYPGDLVYYVLDEQSLAFATAYESTPRSQEIVQPGDTLATIAQRVYGDSTAWRSIWRQNDSIDNPDVVPPGTIVYYLSQTAFAAQLATVKAQLAAKTLQDAPQPLANLDASAISPTTRA